MFCECGQYLVMNVTMRNCSAAITSNQELTNITATKLNLVLQDYSSQTYVKYQMTDFITTEQYVHLFAVVSK
jgi:hypothetical protein